jgi:Ca-activated chloride channel homolog
MVSPSGSPQAAAASIERSARGICHYPIWIFALLVLLTLPLLLPRTALAQDDPLNQVHINTPLPLSTKATTTVPLTPGASLRSGIMFQINTNLVLVPLTVTDPMDRLVTGLEEQNFEVYEDNRPQVIRAFSCDDAPVSIGIILDLSGSMADKIVRARGALLQFMQTSNPDDEFFVIGFNDRPFLLSDFTSDINKVEANLVNLHPERRTALLDAIYLGLQKMKQAKWPRKALLIISDGGDNNSRYTEGEVRSAVRESDVQIYALGIFDAEAPTIEEQNGPLLLNAITTDSGGRLFRVDDLSEMGDIATRISAELRDEYVLGYSTNDMKMDGKWRKVKVKLLPPPGLPPLTVHARTGYYAPLE